MLFASRWLSRSFEDMKWLRIYMCMLMRYVQLKVCITRTVQICALAFRVRVCHLVTSQQGGFASYIRLVECSGSLSDMGIQGVQWGWGR